MFRRKKGKGIAIPPGGTFQFPLPPVRFDLDKCFILIGGQEELLDENGFIIEISADNSRPLRVKVYPDFKNKRLEAIEIIDANDNKEYPKDGPKLEFGGIGSLKKDHLDRFLYNINKQLKELDKEILCKNKKIRRNAYLLIIIISIILPLEIYFAFSDTGIVRYLNIATAILSLVVACILVWAIRNANKIDRDIEEENKKSKKIEIVKEK